ncbi:hypothetical protein D3C80_1072020 [compost metagenome]
MRIELRQQLFGLLQEHLAQFFIDCRLLNSRHVGFHRRHRLRRITQRSEACLGSLEKIPGVGLRVGNQPLQVTLTGTQGVGQVRQGCGVRCSGAKQIGLGIVATTPHQGRWSRQHQHGQGATYLLQQTGQGLHPMGLPAGLQRVTDLVLDLLQHRVGFL